MWFEHDRMWKITNSYLKGKLFAFCEDDAEQPCGLGAHWHVLNKSKFVAKGSINRTSKILSRRIYAPKEGMCYQRQKYLHLYSLGKTHKILILCNIFFCFVSMFFV